MDRYRDNERNQQSANARMNRVECSSIQQMSSSTTDLECLSGDRASSRLEELPTSFSETHLLDHTILRSPLDRDINTNINRPMVNTTNTTNPQLVSNSITNSMSCDHIMNDDNLSTITKLSCQSLPEVRVLESDLTSRVSSGSYHNRTAPRYSKHTLGSQFRDDFSRKTNSRSWKNSRRDKIKFGFIKLEPDTIDLIYENRHMLTVVVIATLYALIAFVLVVTHQPTSIVARPNSANQDKANESDEWTQEMIYAWFRDRSLALSSDSLDPSENSRSAKQIKVRECRSSDTLKKVVPHHSTTTTTTKVPLVNQTSKRLRKNNSSISLGTKQQIKFEALNGCLFRLDSTSESMGDICCCAGIPRYILVPDISSSNETTNRNLTSSQINPLNTTKGSSGRRDVKTRHVMQANYTTPIPRISSNRTTTTMALTTTTTTQSPKMRRQYLKPHIMCFPSSSANLFNAQKLVAPLVSDYTLRHVGIKDKGKCITCSCCHEHSPNMVNKMLANVPLETPESLPVVVDKDGNQIEDSDSIGGNNEAQKGYDSIWVQLRERLVEKMRQLDRFFFQLIDLFQVMLFMAKQGEYPNNVSDPSSFILMQSALVQPENLYIREDLTSSSKSTKLPLIDFVQKMYIDEDVYSPFTTTTTTTSSTTTTRKPRTKRLRSKRPRISKSSGDLNHTKSTSHIELILSTTSVKPKVIIELFAQKNPNGTILSNNGTRETQDSNTGSGQAIRVIADAIDHQLATSDSTEINLRIKLDQTTKPPKLSSQQEQQHSKLSSSKQIYNSSGAVAITELNVTSTTTTKTTNSSGDSIQFDRRETQTSTTNLNHSNHVSGDKDTTATNRALQTSILDSNRSNVKILMPPNQQTIFETANSTKFLNATVIKPIDQIERDINRSPMVVQDTLNNTPRSTGVWTGLSETSKSLPTIVEHVQPLHLVPSIAVAPQTQQNNAHYTVKPSTDFQSNVLPQMDVNTMTISSPLYDTQMMNEKSSSSQMNQGLVKTEMPVNQSDLGRWKIETNLR